MAPRPLVLPRVVVPLLAALIVVGIQQPALVELARVEPAQILPAAAAGTVAAAAGTVSAAVRTVAAVQTAAAAVQTVAAVQTAAACVGFEREQRLLCFFLRLHLLF